jgi:Sulfotransferase domain
MRPNLFLVGAMKCGTSTLHTLLDLHPRITMSEPKEPGYFIDDADLKRDTPLTTPLTEQQYLALFKWTPDTAYAGESSTYYTKYPRLPCPAERIHAFNTDSRILYLVRDPVDRMASHYQHQGALGRRNHPDIAKVLAKDDNIWNVTDYALQIRRYINVFGRQRVLILSFEDMVRDTSGFMNSVLQWLDVEPMQIPSARIDLSRPEFNVSNTEFLSPRLVALEGAKQVLVGVLPTRVKALFRGLYYRKHSRKDVKNEFRTLSTAYLARLRQIRDDIEQLQPGVTALWQPY